ncbi:hypothetical protein, partial [Escherichia coli]|uniref:hypothetical protein n=1 Tax=Escherichia coli TaxID=562 RepID=UPI0020247A8C
MGKTAPNDGVEMHVNPEHTLAEVRSVIGPGGHRGAVSCGESPPVVVYLAVGGQGGGGGGGGGG